MGALYSLTLPNGKQYIGITLKTTEQRWAKHVEHALGKRDAGYLYNALRKHGVDRVKVETLVISDSPAYLRELEQRAIVAFGTRYPHGYNIAGGGELSIGPRSEEARQRISVAQKARFAKPEERARLLAWGAAARAVTSARHAAARVDGLPKWKRDAIARRLKTQLGEKAFRIEHGRRVSEALRRPEVVEKMRAHSQAKAADPAWRAKISAIKKASLTRRTVDVMTAEERQRRSDGAKRMWDRRKAAKAGDTKCA